MKSRINKGIFYYLMRLCIIIIIICSILMSGINIFQTARYSKKENALELKQIADMVNSITEKYIENEMQEAYVLYDESMDRLAEAIDGTIVIVDSNGNIYNVSGTDVTFPSKIDMKEYGDVLQGRATYRTGAFNDVFRFNTFSVASPFVLNESVQGIIFVITRNEVLNREIFASVWRNLISVAIAILAALVTSYFLSRSLIKPLKRIENSAKEIALGRYSTIHSTTKISEYNEVVTTFNKMSVELEKQDKARSDFIANVSHDLRTPLTSIMGYIRGIMDGTIPAEMQNQYLGVVLSEAERMQHMVENNLDLSKYESGNFVPNMSEFDLNDIIRSIVISMEKRIREKDIVIQFKYEKPQNIVEADESAIYRVIQNLLDNALKFAAISSEIEISIKNRNNLAYCSIKNYGSSISEEEQKYIWDRYYKADQSRSMHKKGSGLGLFIVKSIINQHNQHITIASDENSVEFEFTLNLKQ